ncbi:MAG TPA: N-acetylmuramoyl-L-alanine amidase [Pseudonocardiaceae bacterium]|nr:N-acetylmuramoyl-L-alanine amidase [Pseudonocardiaceae bacterium]
MVAVGAAAVVALVLAVQPAAPAHIAHQPMRDAATATHTNPSSAFADGPIGPLDPSQFAPGACVAFAPTHGDQHRTVFLDAGHGVPDPGALGHTSTGQQLEEKQLTLPVVLDAAHLLQAKGYRVVVSRTTDTSIIPMTAADLDSSGETSAAKHDDTVARITCANLAKAFVLVSVHFDAYTSSNATGAMTFYDPGRSFSAANDSLATLLQSDIVNALDATGASVHDRGIQSSIGAGNSTSEQDRSYGRILLLGPAKAGYLDNPSTMPGALVEPLFITNGAEGSLAASPTGQQAIASGITTAIGQFAAQSAPAGPPVTTSAATGRP